MEKVRLVGWFLLFFGLFSIISNFIYDDTANILWFCYIGMVLMGIGILFKKAWLIETQLNILLIPIVLWVLDFSFFLFVGEPLLGISDYLFMERPLLFQIISLGHFFSVPFGLYALSKIKKKPIKLSWFFSIIQLIIIFILTRIVDVNKVNVNWVFENYTPFNLGQFYIINWFVITIIFTLLGYFLISKFSEINSPKNSLLSDNRRVYKQENVNKTMKILKKKSAILTSVFLLSMLFLSVFVMAGSPAQAPEPQSNDIPLPASVQEVVDNYLAEFSSEIITQQLLSVTGDSSNVILGNFQNISMGDKRDISIRLYVDEPDINYIDGDYQIQYANWVILDNNARIIDNGEYQRISSGVYEEDLSLSFYKDGDFALIPYIIQYNIDYNFTATEWEDKGYDVVGKEGQYIFVAPNGLFFQGWMMLIILLVVFGGIFYFFLKQK